MYYGERANYKDSKGTGGTHTKILTSYDLQTGHNWVCFGDLNRAIVQERRGGAAACLQSSKLSQSISRMINSVSLFIYLF